MKPTDDQIAAALKLHDAAMVLTGKLSNDTPPTTVEASEVRGACLAAIWKAQRFLAAAGVRPPVTLKEPGLPITVTIGFKDPVERDAAAMLASAADPPPATFPVRDWAPKPEPTGPWFSMDGSRHYIGDPSCRGCVGGAYKCEECGGLVHEQPVYGPSIVRICDRCGKPDDDRPPEPMTT